MGIRENLDKVKSTLAEGVKLIAVSKTRSEEEIMEAYEAGQRDFGENKVQELVRKMDNLPQDIKWHLIGYLQTNKVKYLDQRVSLIHSLDRVKLLDELDKNAKKKSYIQDCLIEINIGREESKTGIFEENLPELLNEAEGKENIRISGLMAVIPICGEDEQKKYFMKMKEISESLKKKETDNIKMDILSMGMSGDYKAAMECGSTMVRIGTAIFGPRDYGNK